MNGITSASNLMKIYQTVQKLLVRDRRFNNQVSQSVTMSLGGDSNLGPENTEEF
jgi:hypothetical protein